MRLRLLVVLSLAPWPAVAGENGVTAMPVLQVPTSPRAAVLGPGFAGMADDLYALHYNPAGLSLLQRQEATFLYVKGIEDSAVEFAGYGRPLPFPGLLNMGSPAIAAGLLLSKEGRIEVNRTNADGSFRDTRSLTAGSQLIASFAYAEKVGEDRSRGGRTTEYFVGFGFKHIRSTLAQEFKATTNAGDAGFIARLSEPSLTMGISAVNFGPPLKYLSDGDPLPLTYRVGLSWDVPTIWDHTLLFVAGGDYSAYERSWFSAVGAEFVFQKSFAARAGYRLSVGETLPVSAGFGFLQEDFHIDYAWLHGDTLSDQHRVSVTYRFGEPVPPQVRRKGIKDIELAPHEPDDIRRQRQDPTKAPGGSIIVPGWE